MPSIYFWHHISKPPCQILVINIVITIRRPTHIPGIYLARSPGQGLAGPEIKVGAYNSKLYSSCSLTTHGRHRKVPPALPSKKVFSPVLLECGRWTARYPQAESLKVLPCQAQPPRRHRGVKSCNGDPTRDHPTRDPLRNNTHHRAPLCRVGQGHSLCRKPTSVPVRSRPPTPPSVDVDFKHASQTLNNISVPAAATHVTDVTNGDVY